MTTEKAKAALKIPATVGAAIDFLAKIRDERKAIEAKAAELKERETRIEDELFQRFKKADLDGARGKVAQASVSRDDVPTIADWDKFAAYVLRTKALELLQRRVGVEAVRERWAAKQTVPGVTAFTRVRLHLTKLKK